MKRRTDRIGPRRCLAVVLCCLGWQAMPGASLAQTLDVQVMEISGRAWKLQQAGRLAEAAAAYESVYDLLVRVQGLAPTDSHAINALKSKYSTERLYAKDASAASKTGLRLMELVHALPYDATVLKTAVSESYELWPSLFGVSSEAGHFMSLAALDQAAEQALARHGREVGLAMARYSLAKKADEVAKLGLLPDEARGERLAAIQPFHLVMELGDPIFFLESSILFKDLLLDSTTMDLRIEQHAGNSPAIIKWLGERSKFRSSFPSLAKAETETRLEELTWSTPWHLRKGMRLSRAEIEAMLPEGAAFIDYVAVPGSSPAVPARYACVAFHGGQSVGPLVLGDTTVIDGRIAAFQNAVIHWLEKPQDTDRQGAIVMASRSLHVDLVAPVLEQLPATVDQLILGADGMLHFVPFAFLSDESGRFLVESKSLRVVDSHRGMAIAAARRPPARELSVLLVGNPAFALGESNSSGAPPASRLLPVRSLDASSETLADGSNGTAVFTDLPGAGKEATKIEAVANNGAGLGRPVLLTGEGAIESRVVAEMMSARFVHLATHGFTLVAADGKPTAFPREKNPMNLAGLALVGAEETILGWQHSGVSPVGDDGILLASEIAELNLNGVDRVVLSACDTGLGHIVPQNGVLGLRRAFSLSGVPEMVITLWPVLDEVPGDLMADFYQRLGVGGTGVDAWTDALRTRITSLREAGMSEGFLLGALGTFVFIDNQVDDALSPSPARVVRQALQATRGLPVREILANETMKACCTPAFLQRVAVTTGGRIGAVVLMLPDRLLFHSFHLEDNEALVFMGHEGETVFVLVRENGQWRIDDIL